jgi:hypothetical protein
MKTSEVSMPARESFQMIAETKLWSIVSAESLPVEASLIITGSIIPQGQPSPFALSLTTDF